MEINPGHLGALEYQGEMFVQMGQMGNAMVNLTTLESLCGTCEEMTDLKEAIELGEKLTIAERPDRGPDLKRFVSRGCGMKNAPADLRRFSWVWTSASALFQAAVAQHFGDLHRVQRRALAQVVGDAPQVDAVVDRGVLPDAADVGRVVAHAFDRA